MHYALTAIADAEIPRCADARWQHVLDTYASETNKLYATWMQFADADLEFRPHPKSAMAGEIMRHELLSARRFFAEFLGLPEPPPGEVLPAEGTAAAFAARLQQRARARLGFLAGQDEKWWLEVRPFFDTERQRIWIFWRRILHTAHHRTQLTVYLRLLNKPVPATYGPTADVNWEGSDPTTTVESAGRR